MFTVALGASSACASTLYLTVDPALFSDNPDQTLDGGTTPNPLADPSFLSSLNLTLHIPGAPGGAPLFPLSLPLALDPKDSNALPFQPI